MSKYIDSSGLTYLWSKIKAYIKSLNYTSNIGTVTGITMNNTSYSPVNGDVDIGTVVTDVSSKANDSEVVHKVYYDDYNYINETEIAVSNIRIDAANVRGRLEINDEYNGEIYLNDDNDHRWGMIKGDWGETLQQALNARNNVQADWNQTTTTADDYIKNKPTIPTVYAWAQAATKPSYTAADVGAVPITRTVNGKALSADISLTASDVGALSSSTVIPEAQVNSDWNASSGVAQILNKPTIPTVPTNLSSFTDDLGSSPTHTHSQYLTSETEPDFNGSAAATITSSDISNWNGKTSNVGTITGITMNGASKGTSGVVDLGTVITDVSTKQDILVSGTNIKTINNQSILGSGDIAVSTITFR